MSSVPPSRTEMAKPWWQESGVNEANQLIHDEAIRRGEPSPIPPTPEGRYGSGWFIEFPRYVAKLVREEGMQVAADYVKWTFEQGTTKDAFEKIQEAHPDENFYVAAWGQEK